MTKDLVVGGVATTKLILTEEMKDIYEKMKEINITETKESVTVFNTEGG